MNYRGRGIGFLVDFSQFVRAERGIANFNN